MQYLKNKLKKKTGLRIFKCLKEIKGYFAYRKIVNNLSNTKIWKDFKCEYSATRKFGFIVRLYPQYLYSEQTDPIYDQERIIRVFIADYIRPFTNTLNSVGLFDNFLKIDIKQRLGEDEMKMIDNFLFFEVTFAYDWRNLTKTYIFFIFSVLLVCGIFILNFKEIVEFFKHII